MLSFFKIKEVVGSRLLFVSCLYVLIFGWPILLGNLWQHYLAAFQIRETQLVFEHAVAVAYVGVNKSSYIFMHSFPLSEISPIPCTVQAAIAGFEAHLSSIKL